MFPFHTWLPDAHTDAPTAGSVILAAVLLKMGTYGFIRFSLPILPEASRDFVPMMAALAIIGIVYGALVALAQTRLEASRRLLEREPHGDGGARHLRADAGRDHRQHRPADQPRRSRPARCS